MVFQKFLNFKIKFHIPGKFNKLNSLKNLLCYVTFKDDENWCNVLQGRGPNL